MEPEGFHPLLACALTSGRLLSPVTQLPSASTARQSPASQAQEYSAPHGQPRVSDCSLTQLQGTQKGSVHTKNKVKMGKHDKTALIA